MRNDKINFYIELKGTPNNWYPAEDDMDLYKNLDYVFCNAYTGIPLKLGHHPILRYEDITAHLFMQLVKIVDFNLRYNRHVFAEKRKAARQYANQAVRKVCWNCRYYDMDQVLSQDFADRVMLAECNHMCRSCRVARVAIFANSFEKYLKGASYWQERWFDTMANYKAVKRTLKHSRKVNEKIIAAKREVEKELREYKLKGSFTFNLEQPQAYDYGKVEYDAPYKEMSTNIGGSMPITYSEEELQAFIDDFGPGTEKLSEEMIRDKSKPIRESDEFPNMDFDKALKDSMEKHKETMKRLAEMDEEVEQTFMSPEEAFEKVIKDDDELLKKLSDDPLDEVRKSSVKIVFNDEEE